MTIADRARQRFDSIRNKALSGFDIAQVSVDPPSGWCLSTIGRLQTNCPDVISRIAELRGRLGTIADLYLYPPASLHLSLLGCTQREDVKQTADRDRTNRIRCAVESTIRAHRAVRMKLGQLNLLGTRFFIEVIPDSCEWSRMRSGLTVSLERIGERPISYADREPVHLNVARILSAPNEYLLENALTGSDFSVDEAVMVETIELVLTDFVVSPGYLEVLDVIPLASQN